MVLRIRFFELLNNDDEKSYKNYAINLKKTNAVDIPENIREAISCLATNLSIEFVKKNMVEFKKVLNFCLFFIFMTEIISRTDEGQPRPKYIFNKMWN